MRRRFSWDIKYFHWGVTAFCVVAAGILFYAALNFLPALGAWFGKVFSILSPFVWGLVLTYLLSPFMKMLERFFTGRRKNGRQRFKKTKTARVFAVILAEVALLLVLSAFVSLIIPQLYSSIETIVTSGPQYVEKAGAWIESTLSDYPVVEQYLAESLDNVSTSFLDLVKNTVLPSLGSLVSNLTTGVVYAFKGVYNLIIGIVVSIYLLSNLEPFINGSRKVLYSIFSIESAERIRSVLFFIDKTFMGFIVGKLLDSAIIGVICYLVCAILNIPYALLVSVIVGVTNIIPFFGPFIGAIPSSLIILLVDPVKCLVFVIFIIILQQIDGNIIGPKILSSSIGINGFWVMFSIILGGGLWGFVGMIIGVPVFVVIYAGIKHLIDRKLEKSDLPKEAASYKDLDYIDPVTREVHLKKRAKK